jgi:hypothetical protein
MTRFGTTLTILIGATLGVAACSDSIDEPDSTPPPGATTGGDDNTFDHDNDAISVWDLIDRLTKEGPPKFTSHMHSCSKVRVQTFGTLLTSVGVNLASTTAGSAGALYRDPATAGALGAPNFGNRIRENIGITTSGASREFDIFAAAATEVITNLPNLARCQVGGVGPAMFDASDNCNPDAITCLIGVPAQTAHIELCNLSVHNASDPTIGKRLAVAALLAAAYTCE